MPINYALFENNLTSDPDDYAAHVEITASADMQTIANRMIEQGSTVTSADILAVLEDTIKACEALLLEGYNVNLGGLVRLHPTIKGKFDGPDDKFDKSRHRVDVGASPGTRVRDKVRNDAKVRKDEAIKPTPDLITFHDTVNGTSNHDVKPGGIGAIIGHRLKYDEAQADEGIFFVSAAGADTKVVIVQRNMPAELVFISPQSLTIAETYHVEVRARIQGGTELRTGRLDAGLVATP